MTQTATTRFRDMLDPKTVCVRLKGETKAEVITGLVHLLDGHPHVHDVEAVQQAVQDREALMSTGVGAGIALPHARTNAVSDTVAAFATTAEPIDFDAIDEKPVRMMFLLVGPQESHTRHIRLLSRISRLMNQQALRDRLMAARSKKAILEAFAEFE